MSWSIQLFRLVSKPTDAGLFCGADKLTLGGAHLLAESDLVLAPRPADELPLIFNAAYGPGSGIDAESRLSCFQSVAHALNDADLCRAMITSLMLKLPDIDSAGMSRLARSAMPTALKYDANEPRDRRGRWTTGDREGGSGRSRSRGAVAPSRGRWPNIHRDRPNLIPAQVELYNYNIGKPNIYASFA